MQIARVGEIFNQICYSASEGLVDSSPEEKPATTRTNSLAVLADP